MSTTCTKDYVLTVKSALTADLYWTFDNPGAEVGSQFTQIDRVHSQALTSSFFDFQGPPYVLYPNAGGLYGSGLAWKILTGPFNAGWGTGNSAFMGANGTGWSVVFWFKILFWANTAFYGVGPTIELDFASNNTPTDTDCLIDIGFNNLNAFPVGGTPLPNLVSFFINDSVGTDTIAPAAFSPTLNQWNMLHVFFIKSTGTFGYSVNNGTNVTVNGIQCDAGPSGSLNMFQTWNGVSSDTIQMMTDEVAVKMSRILTPTEVTFLYNSGSGRTWPL